MNTELERQRQLFLAQARAHVQRQHLQQEHELSAMAAAEQRAATLAAHQQQQQQHAAAFASAQYQAAAMAELDFLSQLRQEEEEK
eukprot:CAMPEP_0113432310 /NCGR_PEP_ID=MMETSP0013_2-20120614/34102_1 /TAXON_ID=2843 ORGANISM="Skeletonema costatum, Strain 1716" /NCGR_SAMPLE_ID=MMETSP0013_2 /ASSEMBLY_ACC=CAM_ASM_000158 /LENGTH=84 /DNA_ID=CAMNT_0000321465 /DNA_START=22 /DNA_END=273 /DNA_ORIENTATION=+ /assembly_acc=CAM_ASM_000158